MRDVGSMIATAVVATAGDAQHIVNGRQTAADPWLTPKQHDSGDKDRMLGNNKRSDPYIIAVC